MWLRWCLQDIVDIVNTIIQLWIYSILHLSSASQCSFQISKDNWWHLTFCSAKDYRSDRSLLFPHSYLFTILKLPLCNFRLVFVLFHSAPDHAYGLIDKNYLNAHVHMSWINGRCIWKAFPWKTLPLYLCLWIGLQIFFPCTKKTIVRQCYLMSSDNVKQWISPTS